MSSLEAILIYYFRFTGAIQPRHENVKMFQQPGASTQILKTLTISDKVEFVRKHNA